MLNRFSQCLAILAVLALSAPVFAHSEKVSQPLELNRPATIGNTTLQPGNYDFKANLNSNQVQVERDGRLVATIEGKEVTLNKKAPYGAVVMDGRRIHEIQFGGKIEAIEIPNS
jgi:hypothetical protein